MKHAREAESLFLALAEDLKAPLTRIAYRAEVAGLQSEHAEDIRYHARQAIELLDAYMLGMQETDQTSFVFEPISPGAVLADAAYALHETAKKFSCQLTVENQKHQGFALGCRPALVSAMTRLGSVFIASQGAFSSPEKEVMLSTYNTQKGIAVGIFQNDPIRIINAQLLARANGHMGKAVRPFAGFAHGASAQLFVAEQLLARMNMTLRPARRGSLYGLAFDLQPTRQLALV